MTTLKFTTMKKTILIFFSAISLASHSQENLIGIKGGISGNNILSRSTYFKDAKIQPNFSGGVTFEHRMKNHFSIGADLLYSRKGFRQKMTYYNSEGLMVSERATQNTFDYLNVPVMIGYHEETSCLVSPVWELLQPS